MEYIKKASYQPTSLDNDTQKVVDDILKNVRENKENAVLDYSKKLDNYSGVIVVDHEKIAELTSSLSHQLKKDIHFAYNNVKKFAEKQKESLSEFSVKLEDGLVAGQKLVPIETVGCYVPGGRYAHIASAIMSIVTAKVAGVKNIIACSSPYNEKGMHPAILYAMKLAGADIILNLGGVQAIATMTYGLFDSPPVSFIVGPGNRFVAEAKRKLFGDIGIDQIAGPTEILIIADETADPMMLAIDLVGQAEHGTDSPAWLVAISKEVAEKVVQLVPEVIEKLPENHKKAAKQSWADYGEVVICSSREEAVKISDEYAPEHLELQTKENDWYKEKLTNYGSLFVGEETTVAFGDKCSGTNHILPTRKAAKYTGGLSVQKFIKILTWQEMSKEANRTVGAATARISRYEGMEAHARTADARLKKYFPNEDFLLE